MCACIGCVVRYLIRNSTHQRLELTVTQLGLVTNPATLVHVCINAAAIHVCVAMATVTAHVGEPGIHTGVFTMYREFCKVTRKSLAKLQWSCHTRLWKRLSDENLNKLFTYRLNDLSILIVLFWLFYSECSILSVLFWVFHSDFYSILAILFHWVFWCPFMYQC